MEIRLRRTKFIHKDDLGGCLLNSKVRMTIIEYTINLFFFKMVITLDPIYKSVEEDQKEKIKQRLKEQAKKEAEDPVLVEGSIEADRYLQELSDRYR